MSVYYAVGLGRADFAGHLYGELRNVAEQGGSLVKAASVLPVCFRAAGLSLQLAELPSLF